MKIVQNTPYEPIEFYNLDKDPGEEAALENEGTEYRQLFEEQQRHIQRTGSVIWQEPGK
jgi:hypothetical protein